MRYTLVIHYPGRDTDPDAPTDGPRVRRFGPFGAMSAVEMFSRSLTFGDGRARPDDYRLETVPFDEALEHEPVFMPTDAYALAEMIQAEPDGTAPAHTWPDVYDLVVASRGHDAGTQAYQEALAVLDAADAAEQFENKAEQRAAERVAAARALIVEAVNERPGRDYPDAVVDQAAALLADMLDLSELHGITSEGDWGFTAKLPGVCLEGVAAKVAAELADAAGAEAGA